MHTFSLHSDIITYSKFECAQKPGKYILNHCYFNDNFSKFGPIVIFLTVKIRNELQRKPQLKLPPLISVVAFTF